MLVMRAPARVLRAMSARDLVCGMDLEAESAPASSEFERHRYYFCGTGCKKRFEENPQKYIRRERD